MSTAVSSPFALNTFFCTSKLRVYTYHHTQNLALRAVNNLKPFSQEQRHIHLPRAGREPQQKATHSLYMRRKSILGRGKTAANYWNPAYIREESTAQRPTNTSTRQEGTRRDGWHHSSYRRNTKATCPSPRVSNDRMHVTRGDGASTAGGDGRVEHAHPGIPEDRQHYPCSITGRN